MSPAQKPNVLFILTDDQRYDTIAALGNPIIQTPYMDFLVDHGTAFTKAHIPCGTSGAICMPSRAMIHTGRTLFHLYREGQDILPTHTTLGECLKSAGYQTFGTGKWHNGTAAFNRSFEDGSAIFFGGMWDHWNVPVCHYDPAGLYDNEINTIPNFYASNEIDRVHCDQIAPGRHSTELISHEAIRFIKHMENEPFFLYVSFLAPHDPRSMPEAFHRLYDPDQISLPDNFMTEHPFCYGIESIRDETLAKRPRDPKEIRRHIAEYYAMISHLDYEIGRILEALEQTGKADRTLVILAGDNGLALGQHGLMGKQNCYEHSIRIPLIFSGPGIPEGLLCDQYVYLLDIFPTLCDLLKIDHPKSVEGLSLCPLMQNPNKPLRETLYFAYTDLIRAVKDDRFKLIEYKGQTRHTQLFDLKADPSERQNLYGSPGSDPTVSRLRSELKRYRDLWEEEKHPLGASFWLHSGL